MFHKSYRRIVGISFFLLLSQFIRAQEIAKDTLKTPLAKPLYTASDSTKSTGKTPFKIIPREATLRSLRLPGWGQYYNGQPWKIPFVAAAFGVNIFLLVRNNMGYVTYHEAYYQLREKKLSSQTVEVFGLFQNPGIQRDLTSDQLKVATDYYRRYRDLSIFFLAVTWAANVIDANITAHLKTFDVTDDISLRVKPSFNIDNMGSPIVGTSLVFSFK